MPKVLRLTVVTLCLLGGAFSDFNLLVLHNNDIHGRFDETERNSGTCKNEHRNVSCVGAFARIAHELRRYRKLAEEGRGAEVLFLNAGDIFVGTTWYSIFTWNISAEFMNLLEPDALTLGNHEFDGGIAGLAPYINAVRYPIVVANLNFTNESSITGVQKSVVIEKAGRKIGIIGHLTRDTMQISSPGRTIFLDEVESVKNESEWLDSTGVKIIIALGHSGYLLDQRIAAEVPLVDAVVGGHTNTFLWNGPQPDLEEVNDPYPKVVTQPSGKRVPVVQAYAYTKYLGRLNLTFDDDGELISFGGQPELLDNSVPQDEDVLQLLNRYRPEIDNLNVAVAGQSKVTLDGNDVRCRSQECNFGNLIADALVLYKASVSPEKWTEAPIGLCNGGSIRTTIEPDAISGNITLGELLAAIPFGNQVITLSLNGSDLIKTLEIGARSNGETSRGEFLQVSGLRVVFDMSRPPLSRVVSVKARCGSCEIPTYEDVEPTKIYTIITTSFLATEGGDGHYILSEHGFNRTVEDLSDFDVVAWYFKHYSPVYPEVQGRISFTTADADKNVEGFATKIVPNSLCLVLLAVLYKLLF